MSPERRQAKIHQSTKAQTISYKSGNGVLEIAIAFSERRSTEHRTLRRLGITRRPNVLFHPCGMPIFLANQALPIHLLIRERARWFAFRPLNTSELF